MTATELARMVREMRAAQNQYFAERTREALHESMRLERAVDVAVEHVLRGPSSFDCEPEEAGR